MATVSFSPVSTEISVRGSNVGAIVSTTVIVCTTPTVVLPQASCTTYVRVITIGHVPVLSALLVTVKSSSAVHASAIIKSPKPSNPATVVSAAGASLASQPSTVLSVIDPVTTGAVVSSTVIVCTISAVVLPQASCTTYVRVITNGHVPVLASLLVTVSSTHASVIPKSPSNSTNPDTVVCAGASLASQPSTMLSSIVPVTVS